MWQRMMPILTCTVEDAKNEKVEIVSRNERDEFVEETCESDVKEDAVEVAELGTGHLKGLLR